ncbi:MAG: N-acetyltransferase [Actinobacteria bacterium]|nr:N-acetyltransferase [Actinomycetota bacterium]MBO0785446.1 N-acetyltransferase [Actinomycetota bacterium]MBO0815864.1 N-acetyltransferase [Actinomycetota bacterium]
MSGAGSAANRETPGGAGGAANRETPGGDGEVIDNQAASRFELPAGGQLAVLQYRRNGKRLVLIHTEVPDELGGHGIGGRLVAAAAGRAAQESMTVVPLCPFARRWLGRHPEVAAQAPIDWGAAGPPSQDQDS